MSIVHPTKRKGQLDTKPRRCHKVFKTHEISLLEGMEKFILSYLENLNLFKKKNQHAANIKVGEFFIYSGLNKEMSPINVYEICKVIGVIKGRNRDQQIRSLKVQMVKGGKIKEFTRNVRRFCLLELETTNPPALTTISS